MISGGIEVNELTLIRLILEVKFRVIPNLKIKFFKVLFLVKANSFTQLKHLEVSVLIFFLNNPVSFI